MSEFRVAVGDSVEVHADFTTLKRGRVDEVTTTGFRIGKLWFGWHELVEPPDPSPLRPVALRCVPSPPVASRCEPSPGAPLGELERPDDD